MKVESTNISKVKLAANSLAFIGFDFERIAEGVAKSGYRYIEPAFISAYNPDWHEDFFTPREAARVRRACEAQGLGMIAVSLHIDLGRPDAVELFERRMNFAAELGVSIVNTNATKHEFHESFMNSIKTLSKRARALNLRIGIENPGDGSDAIFSTGAEGSSWIDIIDCPEVAMNYDYGNVFTYTRGKRQPSEDLPFLNMCVVHIHLKDISRITAGWKFVPIGSGCIDFEPLFTKIKTGLCVPPLSVELPISFERDLDFRMHPVVPPPSFEDRVAVLRSSLEYIKARLN